MDLGSIVNKLSELKIGLDIRGDINVNNVDFNASMLLDKPEKKPSENFSRYTRFTTFPRYTRNKTYDGVNNFFYKTYFAPTVPITLNDLINSKVYNIGTNVKYIPKKRDFISVFSNLGKMAGVLKYIVGKRKLKPITIDEAKTLGFIEQNINLILSIYFDNKNVLTLKGRKYYIQSFDWSEQFNIIQSEKIKTKSKNITNTRILGKPYYKINVTLYVLNEESNKNPNEVKQLGCKIRKNKINEDLYNLGFIKQKPSNVITKKIKYTTVINPLVEKSKLSSTKKTGYKWYEDQDKKELRMRERLKEIEEQQRLLRERENLRKKLYPVKNRTRKIKNYYTNTSDLFQ